MRCIRLRTVAGAVAILGAIAYASPAAFAGTPPGDPATGPFIVGGHDATEVYPFSASLQNRSGFHFCGAALIRPNWLATAKHCVEGDAPSSIQVRIGSNNRTSGGTLVGVSRIATNPANDAAVLQLTSPVPQAPLPIAGSAPTGASIRLLGWGATRDPGGSSPIIQQELDTTILPDSRCGTGQWEICVNNPGGTAGACYGDSGGPAITRTGGGWALVGMTHAGTSSICAQGPSIYTDAVANRAWIESIVGPGEPPPNPANLALHKPATADSSCNPNEGAEKAVNGSVSGGTSDKWCSLGATKTWRVDLGAAVAIRTVVIRHAAAGGETAAWNTRDYDIQVSTDGNTWSTAVQARGNTASVSTHTVAATARYLRLNVITAQQNGGGAARIYEVEAYA